jgi:SAM-dependent methyltransferase
MPEWHDVYARPEDLTRMLRWTARHAAMMSQLLRHRRVLEIGTGTGMLSGYLARAGVATVSLDYNAAVLRVAGHFYADLEASVPRACGDAFAVPFHDDAFDASFSQGLWEHFGDNEIRAMAIEQLRVAARVYCSVPTAYSPHLGHLGPGLLGNERLLTKRRWLDILHGFDVGANYYADWKLATIAGAIVPWPTHLLLTLRRGQTTAAC